MRLSVAYSKNIGRYGLPEEIQIIATSWLIRVGLLKAILLESSNHGEYTVYVQSDRPGKGIAKMLLMKINEIFQELAHKNKVVISDEVHFLSAESEMKLKKYYIQLGYAREGETLIKIFRP